MAAPADGIRFDWEKIGDRDALPDSIGPIGDWASHARTASRFGSTDRATLTPIHGRRPRRYARIIVRAIGGIRRVGYACHHPFDRADSGLVAWRSCWPVPPRRPPRVVPRIRPPSVPSSAARSWSGYRPGTNWARAAAGAVARTTTGPGTARRRPAGPRCRANASRSGWAGYAPSSAWTGYRPGVAWQGYSPAAARPINMRPRPRPRAEPLCRRTGSELPRIRHRPAGAAGQALAARLAVMGLPAMESTERMRRISTTKNTKYTKEWDDRTWRPARPLCRNTNVNRVRHRSFSCISCISWLESVSCRWIPRCHFEPEEQPALRRREPRSSAATRPFSSNRPTAGVASGRIAIAARSVPASS